MNLWFLLGDPTQRNHGYDHVGSGTATIAVALVVERNPVAAPGILASAHLHVVRHHRSRPDGAGGIAGRVIAQGLLQYLAVVSPKLVWDSFGSWLRTIRPGIPPSEFVVANALRQTLPEFLTGSSESDSLAKFIADRQDTQNMRIFRLAS